MLENQQTASVQTQIPFWRQIRWQLVLAFVLMSVMPIVVIVAIILYREAAQIQDQIFNQLNAIADLKKSQINDWLETEKLALVSFLAEPARREQFISVTQASLDQNGSSFEDTTLDELLALTVEAGSEFEELFVYNNQGAIIASSDPAQRGKVVNIQPYFPPSLGNEQYVQSPYTEISTGQLTMLITNPLLQNGQIIGVLAGRLNLDTLNEIMLERSGLGDSGETYLISQESNKFLTPSHFEGYVQTRAYRSQGIDAVLQEQDGFGFYPDYRNPGVPVFAQYRWVPGLQAGLIAKIDQTEAMASFNQSQVVTALLTGFTALLAIGLGFIIATRISKPVIALTGVAAQVAAGDLNQQAQITQRNEIGVLAEAFNSMTGQLRDLITSLEDRVAERTERLAVLAQITERLSAVLELEKLLKEVVTEIQERFGYYHAHIYLLDAASEHLIVAEGTGPAGAEMKQKRHSISLYAPTSLVARAARTGNIVWVNNVRQDEGWLPNPLLPNTYAEMAVPILLDAKIVGVLDVQEDKVAGLDESDANILQALANQVAVAMRNANLFQEVETALAQARQAQERYTIQAWEKAASTVESTEYLYNPPFIQPLSDDILAAAETEAYNKTAPTMLNLTNGNGDAGAGNTLVAPIKLGEQTIGALQIHQAAQGKKPDSPAPWSEDDLGFIEAVLGQLAQTAENLRLFEETHQQASREQTIREITDKLRSAPSLDILLNTAVQELGQRLELPNIVLELGIQAQNGNQGSTGNESSLKEEIGP